MVSGSKLCGLRMVGAHTCKHEDMLGELIFSHLRQIPRMMPRLTPEKVKARSRFLAIQALSWSLSAFWVPGFILRLPGAALPGRSEAFRIFGPAS